MTYIVTGFSPIMLKRAQPCWIRAEYVSAAKIPRHENVTLCIRDEALRQAIMTMLRLDPQKVKTTDGRIYPGFGDRIYIVSVVDKKGHRVRFPNPDADIRELRLVATEMLLEEPTW